MGVGGAMKPVVQMDGVAWIKKAETEKKQNREMPMDGQSIVMNSIYAGATSELKNGGGGRGGEINEKSSKIWSEALEGLAAVL